MCLILFSFGVHPRYPLVLAANRDEFFDRPTEPAGFWSDAPDILGGRDGKAGGTWMGVHRDGRWAAVTNYRDGTRARSGPLSRGHLVANFLREDRNPQAYGDSVLTRRGEFGGFNLLLGDRDGVVFLSSELPAARNLAPGLYGLSNHLLDTPWPKVERGKRALGGLIALGMDAPGDIFAPALFELLADRDPADESLLPRTGVSTEWERILSAAFIAAPGYGTRASSILMMDRTGEVRFRERSFAEWGSLIDDRRFEFKATKPLGVA